MKIKIKLLNGPEHSFDVHNEMTVTELKNHVFQVFSVPLEDQRLLITGLPLNNVKTIADYPQIKDGTKLNLVPKQQRMTNTGKLEEIIIKHVQQHYSTEDTVKIMKEFMKEFNCSLSQYSLEDYEHFAKSLLPEEQQKSQ